MDRVKIIHGSDYVHRLANYRPRYAIDAEEANEGLPCEWDSLEILLIGAGGLGCELLHLMAMSGFGHITIIDMDTVELSNLNRQFLFREKDIGRPKSEVAAAFVSQRCPGVSVTPIFGRIEDQSDHFYRSFDLIIVGVDSIHARRWIGAKVADIATWSVAPQRDRHDGASAGPGAAVAADDEENEQYEYRIEQAIPFIDTGTEGFEGHCRLFNLTAGVNRTPCMECIMWTFNEKAKQVPMCTLESTPRAPEHCVLYVQMKLWEDTHRDDGLALDADNVEHVRWVTRQARARQQQFNMGGPAIDEAFTLGVIKNVVPAVGFTNALVAGQAVTEALKLAMGVAAPVDNCTAYNGAAPAGGAALRRNHFEANPHCPVCGPRPVSTLRPGMTVPALIEVACRTARRQQPHERVPVETLADATVSLVFPPSSEKDNGRPARPQREVYLAFNSNNPLRAPIVGSTVEAIVRGADDGVDVLNEWQRGEVLPTLRISSGKSVMTQLLRYYA